MLDILIFIFLGLLVGVGFGLVPGLHPNMIILLVPILSQLNIATLPLIAFVVTVGISNTFLDFVPSMLLGAAEEGTELSVLPSHRMLLEGNGYEAVKLAVIGGIGSMIVIAAILPALAPRRPPTARPFFCPFAKANVSASLSAKKIFPGSVKHRPTTKNSGRRFVKSAPSIGGN